MDEKYRILKVLYDITKDDPHPLQYHCSTREILLRLKGNWQQEYLEELVKEKLILVKRSNTVVILLTEKGFEKARISFAKHD